MQNIKLLKVTINNELIVEEFKDIPEFKNYYMISNFGRLLSLSRRINNTKTGYISKNKLLKIYKYTNGYNGVCLCKNGIAKHFILHRIVALNFVVGYKEGLEVNHKDENKENNFYRNLEWMTHKENMNYGTIRERTKKNSDNRGVKNSMYGRIGKNNPKSIPISQYTEDDVFIRNWYSAADINRALGFNASSISGVAKGRCRLAYGFKWRYKKNNNLKLYYYE